MRKLKKCLIFYVEFWVAFFLFSSNQSKENYFLYILTKFESPSMLDKVMRKRPRFNQKWTWKKSRFRAKWGQIWFNMVSMIFLCFWGVFWYADYEKNVFSQTLLTTYPLARWSHSSRVRIGGQWSVGWVQKLISAPNYL